MAQAGISTAVTGLTAELARLVAYAPRAAYAPRDIDAARRAFIDTVGVMLAGRRAVLVETLRGFCRNGDEAVPIIGGRPLSTEDAALLDGVAGHVLDYDDVALHGHPSVVLVPAIFATAQRLGASGLEVLRAYVVGFETWAELGLREGDSYHLRSWHPTAMLGTIAATAAVSTLHHLDADRARHALAIAASMASGIIASFGSQAKPLQIGRAAANAVRAVELARAGITGAPDAIEGEHGFLRGISPRNRVDTGTPANLPSAHLPHAGWRLPEQGLSVKRYPVCYAAHRAIDATIDLATEAGLTADHISMVTVELGRAQARTLRCAHPRNGTEARFSLHHNIAAALLDRQVGFAQLTDDYVRRPDVVALFARTRMTVLDQECPEQPGMAMFDRVVIETTDGRILDSGGLRYARGHARRPLSDPELDRKFLDCALHGGAAGGAVLLAGLRRMDDKTSVAEVLANGLSQDAG